ncbi:MULTISPECIES: SCO3242 family prenyltransferase [unclassified Streptomyces]|uniref:SCO3242 family prenyltransferase n=1 Tax=unclassified Streptomyces TaxID=2593676 RepID=UPI000F483B0F|nr:MULTISPECIES: UbiA family prenyltransferase [unclassified Streptomyces]MCX4768548.1 UbiA family prenyltransferase [Streptomyces sp. NBC_01285]
MTVRAWAELLRVSALFTVPGDALAGAAALGRRPNRSTALAVGASLCLYEAGMALNDWADRDEDAVDRPHRPIPSGRITPRAALAAAGALTAAGLALSARAGRPALTVATGLAATVWAYDLRLKHTPAGPAAMAAARGLDLLLGATATATAAHSTRATGPATAASAGAALPAALPAAALLTAHTYAVTAVSRHEAQGGSTTAPLAALGAVVALGGVAVRERRGEADAALPAGGGGTAPPGSRAGGGAPANARARTGASAPARLLLTALTGAYLRTAARPLVHAALNPSPPLTQRAVGSGIRAMIPLQAALAARSGASGTALAVMGLVPLARSLARKVSPT